MKTNTNLYRARIAGTTLTTLLLLLGAGSLTAQNFSGDSRTIALGGVEEHTVEASQLAGNAQAYHSLVIPLGLIQVLKNRNIYDPSSSQFDPLQGIEQLASPIHFTFNRTDGASGEALVKAIVNGDVSRDLNTYRGFIPRSTLTAKGLLSPSWGKTFGVHGKKREGPYQGVYVGFGPYVSVGTDVEIDPKLISLLASSTNVYSPNTSFLIHNTSDGQAAAAITGGYRIRIPLSGQPSRGISGSKRDGIYLAANYNYLYGFHYDTDDLNVRFDTDSTGMVTLASATTPVVVTRELSSKGRGYSIDLSADVVRGHWDVRGAINGIANHINWQNLQARQYTIGSLLQSLSFTKTTLPSPAGTVRAELPVRYLGGIGYNGNHWAVETELSHGLNGIDFRTGAEYRMKILDLRGGARYASQMWEPSGGAGLNITRHLGIDVAVFGTATNIERARKATLSASLRFSH